MSQRRGQPPKITAARAAELLALVASGLPMAKVAAELGVTRATLYNTTARDPELAKALRSAQAAAKAARQQERETEHGKESCYTNRSCRRPECTAAASAARAARRCARTAPIITLPAPANDDRRSLADTA